MTNDESSSETEIDEVGRRPRVPLDESTRESLARLVQVDPLRNLRSSLAPLLGAQSELAKQMAGFRLAVSKSLGTSEALRQAASVQTNFAKVLADSDAFAGLARVREMGEALRLSTARADLFGNTAALQVHRILENQTSGIRKALLQFAKTVRLIYPPNLRAIEGLSFEDIEPVVMTDGIPLYGVPRTATAKALVDAESHQARREILGRRWKSIMDDCHGLLDRRLSPTLDTERRYAFEAIEALRAGHVASAQALASNLLDTLITRHLAAEKVVLVPSKKVKTPDGYADFVMRKFWALAPIWAAYQHFHPDAVPRRFGRHPSTHAVVPVQYSRRNAVQAVMLVCSLIGYLDEEKSGTRL